VFLSALSLLTFVVDTITAVPDIFLIILGQYRLKGATPLPALGETLPMAHGDI
jgi:hypothetical protein